MNIKLKASGTVEVSEMMRRRGFMAMSTLYEYTAMCGDTYERGFYADGVTYPDGKQPYRTLSIIVPDRPKPKVEPPPEYDYIDEDGVHHWCLHFNI